MATHVSAGDALAVPQVTVLTPTATNSAVYDLLINGKQPASYTADASATVQEIVEGVKAILAALTTPPEFLEMTWTENDTTLIATGLATGKPFVVTDGTGNGTWASITTSTVAKSRNHWIAENFDSRALPANGDTVHVQGLALTQSLYWGLDQSAVTLALLDIRADSQAHIGLPEINTDGATPYYQGGYRDTHLKISADVLRIGDGSGQGSGRIKINTGINACEQTVYKTGNPADTDEAAVHLAGSHATNSLQVFAGTVDIAMLPGYTAQYATIIASGGVVRCGTGVTHGVVEAAGNSTIETRSAVVTLRTRDSGKAIHIGASNITEADVQGGPLKVRATGALTIAQLNGYAGKELDLSECDSLVTVTAMTIYATPGSPFRIKDPNNKLVMTAAASTPNGAQSLVVETGSGRNVRVT